jgi:hypothetical protein
MFVILAKSNSMLNFRSLIFLFSWSILFLENQAIAQDTIEIAPEISTHFLQQENYIDSLSDYRKLYKRSKRIQKKEEMLELAFYVALRYYPELKDTKISVRLKKIKSTMLAQPDADFIVKSRNDRKYRILINSSKEYNGMNYQDLSFNSLVGWIGHELAHITDYHKKSNGQLIQFISHYLFSRKHLKHTENSADKETVKRGLGYSLYEGVTFLFKNPKIFKKYKERNQEYYLSPSEILAEIKLAEQETADK